MKKYFLIPYVLLFWIAAALFDGPMALIPPAGAAVILLMLLQPRKRGLWLPLAAAAAVGLGIYNVQFLLRCVPPLLLVLAHSRALRAVQEASPKRPARFEGAFTAAAACFLLSVAALVTDIAAAVRLRAGVSAVRLCWILAGAALYAAALLVFGLRSTDVPAKKADGRKRRARVAFVFIWACAGLCAAAAAAGCLLNGVNFRFYDSVFPWLLFAAAACGDDLQTAFFARLENAVQ